MSGDESGNFTRFPLHSGLRAEPSTIDFCLANTSCLPQIERFNVGKLTVLSDHCCISMRIKTKFVPPIPFHTTDVKLSKVPEKCIWNPSVAETFVTLVNAPETLKQLSSFRDSDIQPTQQGINTAVDQLTDIVNNVASSAMCQSNRCKRTKGKKRSPPQKRWFSKDCRITKNKLSRLASRMKKSPFDRDLQSRYRCLYYEYKTMIRNAARSYDSDLKNKLLTVEKNDPKGFWRMISKIKKEDRNDDEETSAQDLSETAKKYYDYFTQLYTRTENTTDCDATVFKSYLKPAYREDNIMQILNAPFNKEEVTRGIKKLKSRKAPGIDKILNEFLKSGREVLSTAITLLFNKILQSGKYPEPVLTSDERELQSFGAHTEKALSPQYFRRDRCSPRLISLTERSEYFDCIY